MIQRIAFALIALCVTLFAPHAEASNADTAKTSLAQAREGVVALLQASDAATQDKLMAQIVTASKSVDQAVAAALSDSAAPKEAVAKFKEFQEVWLAFKKTRDTEIIPAIRSGKQDVAKGLAKGIQAERFKKMNEILASLGAA